MGQIEFPIEVNDVKIKFDPDPKKPLFGEIGDFVSVRPCAEKYKGKTYLGILLGEFPVSAGVSYNKETKILKTMQINNPTIYIPELKEIVWGCGSWWGVIKDENHLKEITPKMIEDTWYVKLAKEMFKDKKEMNGSRTPSREKQELCSS